jgi:hypothetical protein
MERNLDLETACAAKKEKERANSNLIIDHIGIIDLRSSNITSAYRQQGNDDPGGHQRYKATRKLSYLKPARRGTFGIHPQAFPDGEWGS